MNRRAIAARAILALCATPLIVSCAQIPVPVSYDSLQGTFYTRHSIRGQEAGRFKKIYRSNYLVMPDILPPGSEVKIEMYSEQRVDLLINGIPCQMYYRDTPFRSTKEGVDQFLDKHFVRTKEEVGLDELDDSTQRMIDNGQAAINMTKEQVLMALGYPSHVDADRPTADMPREEILKSDTWKYRYQEILFVPVVWVYSFGADGRMIRRDPT